MVRLLGRQVGHGVVAFAGEGLLDPDQGQPRPDPAQPDPHPRLGVVQPRRTAYAAHNAKLFRLDVDRLRPGYRPAFKAWIALHPLKNPHAPPDPSYLPQYRIPQ